MEEPEVLEVKQEPITLGIVKFDETEELLNKAKEYKSLVINGPGDKEGEKKVSNARKEIKKGRLKIEKDAKVFVEKAKKYIAYVKEQADPIIKELEETEQTLQTEEDRIEKLRQDEKDRIQREAAEKHNRRIDRLFKVGMAFDGSKYTLEDCEIDSLQVQNLSDEEFDDFMVRAERAYKAEQARKEEEKVAAAKLLEQQQAESKRLEEEKAELEKQKEQLRKDQEALQKLKDEQAAEQKKIEDKRFALRSKELESLGFSVTKNNSYELKKTINVQTYFSTIGFDIMKEKSDDSWDELIEGEMPTIEKIQSLIAEEKKQKEAADKLAQEAAAKKLAEEQERLKKEKEEREEALKPDIQKLTEFGNKLVTGKLPVVKDLKAQEIVNDIKNLFEKIKLHIDKKIKELN